MFDKKYLLSNAEKNKILCGFAFWNFSVAFGLITSAITNLISLGTNIYTATQPQSNTSYNKSYSPSFNPTSPYIRLSKYPSKTTVGMMI